MNISSQFKLFFVVIFLSFEINGNAQTLEKQNLLPYVNPLIGTAKMGHTYPGATVPFGAVQLSPDTDTLQYEVNGKYNADVYKYCAG
ncbi:MAG TPA: sugar hydrolase, partial [Bacteroidales bacterium]|nr:sugar hydrolase [Bacteroidales bacterium]